MWRVIVRLSYTSDTSSYLRNTIEPMLTGCGLHSTGTGTWESNAVPANIAANQLGQVLQQAADPSTINNVNPDAHLNHLWIYVDRA